MDAAEEKCSVNVEAIMLTDTFFCNTNNRLGVGKCTGIYARKRDLKFNLSPTQTIHTRVIYF